MSLSKIRRLLLASLCFFGVSSIAIAEEVCTSSLQSSDPEQARLIEDLKSVMRTSDLNGHRVNLESGLELELKGSDKIQVTAVRLPDPALLQIGLEFMVFTKEEIAKSEYREMAIQNGIITQAEADTFGSGNLVERILLKTKLSTLASQVQLQFNANFCRKGGAYVVNLAGTGMANGQSGSFPLTPTSNGFQLGSGQLGDYSIPGGSYVAQ